MKSKSNKDGLTSSRGLISLGEDGAGRPLTRGGSWVLSRVKRFIRLSTYLAVVAAGVGVLAARTGYSQMKSAASQLGDELLRLADAGASSDHYRLRLNGELLNVSTASTNLSVSAALDVFEAGCRERADSLANDFANLKDILRPGVPPSYASGFPGAGILRNELNGKGFVACFAQGGVMEQTEVFGRLKEFAVSGDLGEVGDLRYVAVRKRSKGGALAVAVWADGSLPLAKMFPSEGDAPGADVEGALRPSGTRRVFSAYAEGAPYGVRVYESARPPRALLEEYDTKMPELGWQAVPAFDDRTPNARAFSRGGTDIIIAAEETARGTVLSVTEMVSR